MLRRDQSTPQQPPGDLHVGPYRLLARLGEGGMGVVHLGQDADGRRVAVKVLRPHVVGDEEARQRLAREVDSLSRVRSPRVAEIVDADPWGPIPYVATRYVPGLALGDHVREEGPLTGEHLTWFARGLGEAVQAVHDVGVLHRDIKPSNVVMEGRSPVLIDFGLARVADDSRLTRTGWLLGTPGYIAPEVLIGEDPTRAVDVHGWAATVAFAGLGRSPYGEGPSMAVLDRVRRAQHDLGDLPHELRSLLERALDPDPRHRPSLAAAVGAVGGRPAPAGPPPVARDVPTMPIAAAYAAGLADAEAPTDREPVGAEAPDPDEAGPDEAGPGEGAWTWEEPEEPSRPLMPAAREPYRTPPPADWAPQRTPFVERVRRGTLAGGGLAALAAATGAAPYLTLTATFFVVMLLRWLSVTATSAETRRAMRGAKWYDGVLTALGSPWHLVRSLPRTVVLWLWTAAFVVVLVLVLVLLGLEEPVVLWAAGLATGVLVWTGPGASRVRAPVRRVARAAAHEQGPWFGALGALVLVIGLALWGTLDGGPDWSPGNTRPWQDVPVLLSR